MSQITIYHNPGCGTSRNTLALIRNSGVEPHVVEYLKTPPSRDELKVLLLRLGLSVRDLLAERVYYKQFANVKYADGRKAEKEEVARCYRPGRNIGISVICNL